MLKLQSIINLFKSKGAELTAEEVANLSDSISETPAAPINNNYDNLKHNADAIKELKDMMTAMKEEQAKKDEETKNIIAEAIKEKEETKAALNNYIESNKAETNKAKVDALIGKAILETRLEKESPLIEKYRVMAEKDFENTEQIINSLAPIVPNAVTSPPTVQIPQTKTYDKFLSIADPNIIARFKQQDELLKEIN